MEELRGRPGMPKMTTTDGHGRDTGEQYGITDMMNADGGVLHAEAISDDGYDKNADSRQAPEVKIQRIFARLGSVVIVGLENDEQVEKQITIGEGMLRCRALLDMVKTPWKYKSDLKETRGLLQMFVTAIEDAKKQLDAVGASNGLRIV